MFIITGCTRLLIDRLINFNGPSFHLGFFECLGVRESRSLYVYFYTCLCNDFLRIFWTQLFCCIAENNNNADILNILFFFFFITRSVRMGRVSVR